MMLASAKKNALMELVNQFVLVMMNVHLTKYVSTKFASKDVDQIKVAHFT